MINKSCSILVEGITDEYFLSNYLKKLARENGILLSISRSKVVGKDEVLKNVSAVANDCLNIKNQDFFVVGIDLDTNDPDNTLHSKELKKIEEKLPKVNRDKAIIFIPIQVLDTWLLYQAHKMGNKYKKYPNNGLESRESDTVKRELFNVSKPNRNMIKTLCDNLITNKADFDELAKQSKSFKHFHQQVVKFLEKK